MISFIKELQLCRERELGFSSLETGKSKLTPEQLGQHDDYRQAQDRKSRKLAGSDYAQEVMKRFRHTEFGGTYTDAFTFLQGLPPERKRQLKAYLKAIKASQGGEPSAPNEQVRKDYDEYNEHYYKEQGKERPTIVSGN